MRANPILLQKKYSRVIECFAKQQSISLDAALDFFYHSEVYQLIRDGVSDMHCMSDAYLAEELKEEYCRNNTAHGVNISGKSSVDCRKSVDQQEPNTGIKF